MNKIILYIFGAIFLLGILLRIFVALLYPDRFAEGAKKVLFLDEREKAIFRTGEKNLKDNEDGEKGDIPDHSTYQEY